MNDLICVSNISKHSINTFVTKNASHQLFISFMPWNTMPIQKPASPEMSNFEEFVRILRIALIYVIKTTLDNFEVCSLERFSVVK